MSEPFTPVRTRRTFEEAVDQIVERIRLGELQRGERLPSERVLAEQMRISRPTLREAIRVLQDSGLVEVRRGAAGGIFVANELIPPELLDRRDMRMSEVGAVLEARRLLEPGVARLAARRAAPEDLAAMAASLDAHRALLAQGNVLASGHEDRFLALDHRFHLAIARAAGNPLLARMVRQLYRDLEIARDMAMHYEPVPEWTVAIHERTLAAIRGGDPDEVDAVMDEHLGQVERTWEQETGTLLRRHN